MTAKEYRDQTGSNVEDFDYPANLMFGSSMDIFEGDFVGIMGRSGSGKSTLVNLIGFLDKKFKGTYYFEDKLVEQYTDDALSKISNENVGFVFQNFGLIENMTHTFLR